MATLEGTVVDPLGNRIFPARVTWNDGWIQSVEPLPESEVRGKPFITPGFIDAHVHVESSMLPPAEFARLAIPHGTVATVSDPHEIANVLGSEGVDFMLEEAKKSPLNFCFGAPSCVPATAFETAGARLDAADVRRLLARPEIGYLAEVMNYPGVIAADPDLMEKIRAAREQGKPVDGHSPALRGEPLKRYVGAGIQTDHECSSLEEALEKLSHGMKILIREGSAARNFEALLPLLATHPADCMFCSDDKHPDSLLAGHINEVAARAVAAGFPVLDVLRVACVNPVRHYRLKTGLLQPGDRADFLVLDDMQKFQVRETWLAGKCVSRGGECLEAFQSCGTPNRFHARSVTPADFALPTTGNIARVIEVEDGQLLTRSGRIAASELLQSGKDVLKIAVVNRYAAAPPAVAYVRHVGLRRGALASTVAHDCHNIVAVGASDEDLSRAVNVLMESRGGCVTVDGDQVDLLPLPVAGLMSDLPGTRVAEDYLRLSRKARSMGSPLEAPFMTLSFLALLVIPELKLGDRGLFDGRAFEFVPVFEN